RASCSVIHLPSLVLPYQRSPSLWKTLVSVLTQTIPFWGGVRASWSAGAVAVVVVLAAVAAFVVSVALGAGGVVVVAGGAAPAPPAAAAPAAVPTVTSGVILAMVALGTPAFSRSVTALYGRPAMIFFAVASPTAGRALSSSGVAVLRSTFFPVAAEPVLVAVSLALLDFADFRVAVEPVAAA